MFVKSFHYYIFAFVLVLVLTIFQTYWPVKLANDKFENCTLLVQTWNLEQNRRELLATSRDESNEGKENLETDQATIEDSANNQTTQAPEKTEAEPGKLDESARSETSEAQAPSEPEPPAIESRGTTGNNETNIVIEVMESDTVEVGHEHADIDNNMDNRCWRDSSELQPPPPPPACPHQTDLSSYSLAERQRKCPHGSSVCPTCPELCYRNNRNCDGIYDCPDKADEQNCFNRVGAMDKIYTMAERQNDEADQLRILMMGKPKSCSDEDFFANRCKCDLSDPFVIICEHLNLSMVPMDLETTVHKLRLRHNSIRDISNVEWPKSLNHLTLANNELVSIGANNFKGANNLALLFIDLNMISEIHEDAFVTNTRLQSFQAQRNRLTSFKSDIFRNCKSIKKIDLSYNEIDLPDDTQFEQYKMLEEMFFEHNRITRIKANWFRNMSKLMWLDLSHNRIESIEEYSFKGNFELVELNLSFNRIKAISRRIFAKDLNLSNLWLNSNPLESLAGDNFAEVVRLNSINLSNIKFAHIDNNTFDRLSNLQFIYFSKYYYCKFARGARVCRPKTDGLSSHDHLLAFPILRHSARIIAIVCLLGNAFVFIWHTVFVDENEDKTFPLFIRNLSIADLLMGIYLATIAWFVDQYRSLADPSRSLDDMQWMSSQQCVLIGSIAILSSELSVFLLTIITIERYRAATSYYPIDKEVAYRRARYLVCLTWALSIAIASYPLVEYKIRGNENYETNNLCLPLHIDLPYLPGWQYSLLIYVGINMGAILTIVALYTRLYATIREVHQASSPRDGHQEDAVLALRFFFIILTDCLCLTPIIVIKSMAYLGVDISHAIYGWLVVFIVPINSTLNPIVYTLATPGVLRRFKRVQLGNRLVCGGQTAARCLARLLSSTRLAARSLLEGLRELGARSVHQRHRLRQKSGSNSTTCDTIYTSLSSHCEWSGDWAAGPSTSTTLDDNYRLVYELEQARQLKCRLGPTELGRAD